MCDRPNHHAAIAFNPRMRLYGDVGSVGPVGVIAKADTEAQFGSEAPASQHRIRSERLHKAGRRGKTYGHRRDCAAHGANRDRMRDAGVRRCQRDETVEHPSERQETVHSKTDPDDRHERGRFDDETTL